MSDDIRSIEIMQDNAEHTAEMLDREWAISFDNEAGPGWDYVVVIPGYENIMGLTKEVAERIVDDHNARRSMPLQDHGWRDMATAPKDGTQIIYKCANTGNISNCAWQADDCGFDWYDIGGDQIARPLRWIPLPAMVAEQETKS